jgi:hypothetical protein
MMRPADVRGIGRWTWRDIATLWLAAGVSSIVILVCTFLDWPPAPEAMTLLGVLLSPEYFRYLLREEPGYIVGQFVIPIAAAAITTSWLMHHLAATLTAWSWRPIAALWLASVALSVAGVASIVVSSFATWLTAFWLVLRASTYLRKPDSAA